MADHDSNDRTPGDEIGRRERLTLSFPSFRAFADQYAGRVSAEGMFIESSRPLEVGSEIEFDARLSDGFRLLSGRGEVVWKVDAGTSADWTPGMAIRFRDIDDSSQRLISRLVLSCRERGGTPFSLVRWPVERSPGGKPPSRAPFPEIEAAAASTPELSPEPPAPSTSPEEEVVSPAEGDEQPPAEPRGPLETLAIPLIDISDLDLAGGLEDAAPPEPPKAAPAPEETADGALDLRDWESLLADAPELPGEAADPAEAEEPPPLPALDEPPPLPTPDELLGPPLTSPLDDEPQIVAEGPALGAGGVEPGKTETRPSSRGGLPPVGEPELGAETSSPGDGPASAAPPGPAEPMAPPWAGSPPAERPLRPAPPEPASQPTVEPRAAQAASSTRDRIAASWLRLALLLAGLAVVVFAGLYYRDGGFRELLGGDEPTAAPAVGETSAPSPPPATPSEPGTTREPATPPSGSGLPAPQPQPGSSAEDGPAGASAGPVASRPASRPAAPATGIERVSWRVTDGQTELILLADGGLDESRYDIFSVRGGEPRQVIRVRGVERPFTPSRLVVGTPQIERVRVGLHGEGAGQALHFVVDLAAEGVRVGSVEIEGRRLKVRFTGP
ncbi:MAG: PilZ domain-containing protein [Thermoanaerobaculia bacterium]|nr:PilZ domain-containing protein [Thermoanaerobaculia bacterium]